MGQTDRVTEGSNDGAPRRARSAVGIRDVAERAGVALSSVSRVLAGHPDVSDVMRNRVLDAAASLGYERNLLAQGLRTGATQTVGFIVGDVSNPLLAEIAHEAELALNSSGYTMLLTNSRNDPQLDARYISLLRQRQVDGLLLSLADETAQETVAALASTQTPYVLLDRDVRDARGSMVHSAHDTGMRDAVAHLLALGHTSIALVGGSSRLRPSRERVNALRRACRQAGAEGIVRSGSFTAQHGRTATAELLGMASPPTAIIAGSNQILVGVLQALRSAEIGVPEEMSLVACDRMPLSEFLDPPLATIARDPGEIGKVGAQLLIELIRGGEPRRVVLPTMFEPAASCAPPRQHRGLRR